jgi:hypothetical protein
VLDNRLDIAVLVAEYAAIAAGIVESRGNQGGAGRGIRLPFDKSRDSLLPDQRAIAIKNNQQAAQRFQLLASAEDGVSSALLFGLLNEADSAVTDCCLHLLRLVPHYDEDPFCLRAGEGRRDGVAHQCVASRAVQNFRLSRFHAGTHARRQNYY